MKRALPVLLLAAVPAVAGEPWHRRCLVGIEVGPTGANPDPNYMSRMTGKDVVEKLLLARVEYGVIFMKDMEFAYYDSKAARKCPGLGSRDLLREILDAAAPHGLPIVAYQQIQYDDSTWRDHPEWRMRDAEGKELGGRLCFNSGYLEHAKVIAAELMAYPIAGFHFDMLDFGFGPPVGCWCDACRALFRKEYGSEMPKGVAWDEGWDRMLRFRCASNARFCRDLQEFVRSRRPEISVDFNYHGSPPFSWYPGELPVLHARSGDFVTAEGLPWVFGHNNPSLLSLFMAGARPAPGGAGSFGAVQGVTSRSAYDYHDFTVRPAAEIEWEVLTYLAHGTQCTIVDKADYDGGLDPVAYERMGRAFGKARARRDLFGHRPLPEVGLWYSARSRDWYGRENPARYNGAFWGAHRALVQAHIPMGIVLDESVTIERLREFPVLYLPGAAIVSDAEAALLAEYVAGGGRLLATGITGMYDAAGAPRKESALARLLGIRVTAPVVERSDNYVRLRDPHLGDEGKFLLEDVPAGWPILTWGPAVPCEAAGARAFGETLVSWQAPPNAWSGRLSPGNCIAPAVLLGEHGKGTTAYVPAAVDAGFVAEYRVPEHRNLIRNLLRRLGPAPRLRVEAPSNVEAVVTRDDRGKRTLVHLLAYWAPPTFAAGNLTEGRRVLPTQMEEAFRYEARIRVRDPFGRASAVGAGSRAAAEGGAIRVETGEIHEVVVIED